MMIDENKDNVTKLKLTITVKTLSKYNGKTFLCFYCLLGKCENPTIYFWYSAKLDSKWC